MKLPSLLQFRVLKIALGAIFGKPYTTKFPGEPFEPIKEYRGRPRYHRDDCIGCGACANVCPANCIEMKDDLAAKRPVRRFIHSLDSCIQCCQCERYCTTEKGIKLTNEWDYAGFAPNIYLEECEKDLLMCEVCGGLIGPIDQIKWLANRLGIMAFCNPTLMLVSHKELSIVDEGFEKGTEFPVRGRRINIQCPHCRRTTAMEA